VDSIFSSAPRPKIYGYEDVVTCRLYNSVLLYCILYGYNFKGPTARVNKRSKYDSLRIYLEKNKRYETY